METANREAGIAGNETGDLVKDRMLTYQLLSSLFFIEPSVEMLESLKSFPSNEGKLGEYIRELPDADLEQIRIDLAAEFAAMFLGMSANPVAPYESVYTSPEHLMMQDARDEVLANYRAHGFRQSEDVNLPEDHIAIELEFMARLCEKELEGLEEMDVAAVGSSRSAQKDFLENHLLVWAPQFCEDVRARAMTGFYEGLGELLEKVLEAEAVELEV